MDTTVYFQKKRTKTHKKDVKRQENSIFFK